MRRFAFVALAAPAVVVTPAVAETAGVISARENGGFARIAITWPQARADAPPTVSATAASGVLVVRFSEPVTLNTDALRRNLPTYVTNVRVDPDRRTLRVALTGPMRTGLSRSYNVQAIDLLPEGFSGAPAGVDSPRAADERAAAARARAAQEQRDAAASDPTLQPRIPVTVGQVADLTRLVFDWPQAVRHRLQVSGSEARLRFERPVRIDLAEIRSQLPKNILSADQKLDRGGVTVTFRLADGVSARSFTEGASVVLDVLPPDQAATTPKTAAMPARPPPAPPVLKARYATPLDPTPAGGLMRVTGELAPDGVTLDFAFKGPAAGAVFRRGDAIWVVFDAKTRFDASAVKELDRRRILDVEPVVGDGVSGLRIISPAYLVASAQVDQSRWRVTVSDRVRSRPASIPLALRAAQEGGQLLEARSPGVRAVAWASDPETNEKIAIALSDAPVAGVGVRREFPQATVISSAHGVVFEPLAPDLQFLIAPGVVSVRRASQTALPARAPVAEVSLNQTDLPGVIDFAQWARGPAPTVRQSIEMLQIAAARASQPETAIAARLRLARYLVAQELGAEALAVLRAVRGMDATLERDPGFLALRGVASLLMARESDAERDFTAPPLRDDPAAALWRGLLAARGERWIDARQNLEAGRGALKRFAPKWRGRFLAALAQAAVEQGDAAGAEENLRAAEALKPVGEDLERTRLLRASLAELNGDGKAARVIYEELSKSSNEPTAVRALYHLASMTGSAQTMSAQQSVEALDALRWRWRGDDLELDIVRALGQSYIAQGRPREALEAMQAAAARAGARPAARRIAIDMSDTFARLFLDGDADKLDPIQALGLFYQFRDLTPVGADGDRMIRKLADRLVAFDLLPQAAELLKHQADKRLVGLAKAQVSADLAAVLLMDRQPEQSLQAIWNSRVPRLPDWLLRERRRLEAAALAEIGRLDTALELIEADPEPDAWRLRADIAWRTRDWKAAEVALARLAPPPGDNPLPPEQEDIVLRLAIARTLSGDQPGLDALRRSHGAAMAKGPHAEAFELVASRAAPAPGELRDVVRSISAVRLLDGFMQRYRARFEKGRPDVAAGPGPQAAAGSNGPA